MSAFKTIKQTYYFSAVSIVQGNTKSL